MTVSPMTQSLEIGASIYVTRDTVMPLSMLKHSVEKILNKMRCQKFATNSVVNLQLLR